MRFGGGTLLSGYGFVVGDVGGVLAGVGSKFLFCNCDVDIIKEIEREGFNLFEIVVIVAESLELGFSAVESIEIISPQSSNGDARQVGSLHRSHPPPYIHLSFNLQILERLPPESLFPQCPCTARYRTWSGSLGENPVHTRLAHFVVAFWVNEKAHVGIEVAGGFANRANVWGVS